MVLKAVVSEDKIFGTVKDVENLLQVHIRRFMIGKQFQKQS